MMAQPERHTQPADPAVAGRIATIPCGTMRLPLRPSTDWRGSPCGMRQSSGQRYRQGYDAAASRDLMLAWFPCEYHDNSMVIDSIVSARR